MDVLLSLPLATYFFAPGLTSWSTSLNLLFFYMTWMTLILSHGPLQVHIVGILALRVALWLIPSLLTLLFDVGVPSLAESIKLGGQGALPPRDGKRVSRLVGLAVLNLSIITALEGASSFGFAYIFQEPAFKTSTTLPLPWQIAKHVVVLLTAREIFTYYIHRFFLHSSNSTYISKQHQRFAHAYTGSPFSLQLFTDHPIPLLLHRFLPIYLPALILRPHLLTYFLFVAVCTAEETLSMSGYSIIPGIVMGGIVRRAAIHYASGGTANYGAWGLLDWVQGTSKGGDVLEDVKAEADKHHVKQRGAKKADQGMGVLQDGMDALRNGSGDGLRRSSRKRTSRRAS
ncbi:Fc.00g009890.m01.CDS01 [Cosmosporella sp. VM-42]